MLVNIPNSILNVIGLGIEALENEHYEEVQRTMEALDVARARLKTQAEEITRLSARVDAIGEDMLVMEAECGKVRAHARASERVIATEFAPLFGAVYRFLCADPATEAPHRLALQVLIDHFKQHYGLCPGCRAPMRPDGLCSDPDCT